jgi:hypothetical protein
MLQPWKTELMKIPEKNLFSLSAILLIFFGFLFSSCILCQAESAENRASYAEYAKLIAGIHSPNSVLAPFESRPAWAEFAYSFDRDWEKYGKIQMAPMRKWAERELSKPISSGLTVFYPFSGPDFISPYTLFPNAGTYVLVALEPIGNIPDFQAMNCKDFDSFFADMRKSLHDLLSDNYFISAHMQMGMESKELDGVLPLLLFFMARANIRILAVEYWFMEPDGTIQKVPASDGGASGPGEAIPGVRISFESAALPGKPQTLYYFQVNLYNRYFRRNSHFMPFLQNFGPFITFMKSVPYVMFNERASVARRFVLHQSRYILQEDSGIPSSYLDPSLWDLQLYGVYNEPISIFRQYYQKDLARMYKIGGDIRPLPFGIGFHFLVDTANLMLATRKYKDEGGRMK